MSQALHDHPWVAQVCHAASGAVMLPTPLGVSALCRQGRGAFLNALDEQLAKLELAAPQAWRLVDAWPDDTALSWADAVLAQPRPADACVLSGQVSGHDAVLALRIPIDMPLFDVHFPELPILPGVVQIAWALAYGKVYFNTPATCRRVEMLKFQRPLRPGDQVQLSLRYDPTLQRLHFGYARDDMEYSSGRLQWEPAND